MRTILTVFLMLCFTSMTAQTHLEYISEPTDSMALISKEDIDIINNVFNERNTLDSLHNVNEQIISNLEIKNKLQLSTIKSQAVMLENKDAIIRELEIRNDNSVRYYSKELKKEKNKKISFQTTTGIGIVAIILILLL